MRRVRDKANQNPDKINEKAEKGQVSDDDKIRLQLYVDVMHYLKAMEQLGIKPQDVDKVEALQELVTQATKNCLVENLEKPS